MSPDSGSTANALRAEQEQERLAADWKGSKTTGRGVRRGVARSLVRNLVNHSGMTPSHVDQTRTLRLAAVKARA